MISIEDKTDTLFIDLLDIEISINEQLVIESRCLCQYDRSSTYDKASIEQITRIRDWLTALLDKHKLGEPTPCP